MSLQSLLSRRRSLLSGGETVSRQLRDALDEAVLHSLQPLSTAMVLVFMVLTVSHLLVLPKTIMAPMVTTAFLTVLILLGVRLRLVRQAVPLSWTYPLATMLACLVLFNSLLHLHLSKQPWQTTNLMLLLIGVSFFLLSRRWFGLFLVVSLGGWVGIVSIAPPSPLWLHFGFAMMMTLVMAVLIHVVQRRRLLRLESLRLRNEQRNAELVAEIAERKQAEEQMHRHQAEMAHMARLVLAGEMASGLAHELNQPLTAISVSSDVCQRLLQGASHDRDRLLQVLEQIGRQSHRAGEMIKRMKNFTRKTELRRAWLSINELIREIAGFSTMELQRHGINLELDLESDMDSPLIFVDGIQIQQVLLNLIRNGMEAMAVMTLEEQRLRICSAMEDGWVRISVHDQGPGLSPEEMVHIFDPFYSTKVDGMGLGLSISQSIVKAHGGRLWVESQPSHGVVACFTLPLRGVDGGGGHA